MPHKDPEARRKYAREYGRKYRVANPDKVQASQNRYRDKGSKASAMLMWRYGVSSEDKAALLAPQGGSCAVCRTKKTCGRGWMLDHWHETGEIRGVLCNYCNAGLGQFRDNTDFLQSAITYLRNAREASEQLCSTVTSTARAA